jgi:hypothetical protein
MDVPSTPKLGVTKCAQTHPCDKSFGAEIDEATNKAKAPRQNRARREIAALAMKFSRIHQLPKEKKLAHCKKMRGPWKKGGLGIIP